MKFWNYIGDVFLFRWLFDKLGKSHKAQKDNCANTIIDSVDVDEATFAASPTETTNIHNEFDLPEDVDELDDLDIFMSNSQSKNNNNSDYGFSRRSYEESTSRYNWDNDGYRQSFDDFHEEQDDYDMMDDF